MADKWFIRRGDEIRGPFPAEALARYRVLGRIRDHDQVSQDKKSWQLAGEVAEINPQQVGEGEGEMSKAEARAHLKATAKFVKKHHLDVEEASDEEYERRFRKESPLWVRLGQYLLVLVIIAVIAAIPFVIPKGEGVDEPDCNAVPAPGVNWRNCLMMDSQLANSDLAGAQLRSANFSRSLLRAANLSGVDGAYTNFSQANLRAANLSGGNFNGANFTGADLSNANLKGADLSYADLRQSDLRDADLRGVRLDNAVWAEGIVCMPGSQGQCLKARR